MRLLSRILLILWCAGAAAFAHTGTSGHDPTDLVSFADGAAVPDTGLLIVDDPLGTPDVNGHTVKTLTWANLEAHFAEQSALATIATTGSFADLVDEPIAIPQAEAEAGTATTDRLITAQRLAQAIAALESAETNDLTAAVTWANVPDGNITQSSVTQHQAALSITESQISDLQSYLLNITGESIGDLSDVDFATAPGLGDYLRHNGTNWTKSGIVSTDLPGANTLDSEWDTFAEINTRTTDTDAVLDTDIGSTVQAWDADLDALAAIAAVNGDVLYFNAGWQRLAKGADGQVLELSGGLPSWGTDDTGAGGSPVVLDLTDDDIDESADITEIATTGDTNNIFTEPVADKLLIAVGNNWPTADTANAGDTATAFFSAGTIEHERGGLEADVSAYDGLIRINGGTTTNVTNLAGLNTAIGASIADGAHTIDTNLTQEEVDDFIDQLINDVDSVHTRVAITYDDINDAMDFVVDDMDNTASGLGGGLAIFDSKSVLDLRFNTLAAADFDLAANVISIDDATWLSEAELNTFAELDAQIADVSLVHTGIDDDVPESGDFGAGADLEATGAVSANAIDNAKLADMAAYTLKLRNAGTSGDPGDVKISSLTEELTPTSGDFILGEIATGEIRRYDVGNLPTGGGGEANTGSNLGGGLANFDSKLGVDLRFNTFAAADFDLASNIISIDDATWLSEADLSSLADLNTQLGTSIADGAHTVDTNLTQEEVDDFIDQLINDVDSVHTRIAITYDDLNDALDFIVDDMDNTASGLGGGLAIFDSKSTLDLRFNTLSATDFDLAANVISIDDATWLSEAELNTFAELDAQIADQSLVHTGIDDDVPEAGDFGNATDLDANGAINADAVGTAEIDDGADTPGSGDYIRVDTVDQAGVEYRTPAEVLSDIGAESATSNDIDPDRLLGDTTDDNLIDSAILESDLAGRADGIEPTNSIAASRDLNADDMGHRIDVDTTNPVTLTIVSGLNGSFSTWNSITTNNLTIAAGAGVTIEGGNKTLPAGTQRLLYIEETDTADTWRVFGADPIKQSLPFTLMQPDLQRAESDDIPLVKFDAETYPNGVTITSIHGSASAAYTSETFLFEHWDDAAGTTQATVESITASAQAFEDDGTFTDATIPADYILMVNMDDTPEDISYVHFEIIFEYYE